MNPRRSSVLILVGIMAWASGAWALDVYLNGVLITGVSNQEIENASVRLDERGNVHIHAPQYRVSREDTEDRGSGGSDTNRDSSSDTPTPIRPTTGGGDAPPAGGGRGLTNRYWLVVQANSPGMVQYRVTVSINERTISTFDDANAPQAPIEVTEYLRPGRNAISMVAEKTTDGERRSDSSRHWLRVVVADGHIEGSSVVIDSPGIIFNRNAAQTDRASREFELQAR